MDERLEKALAFSNYRITIENRRIALKRRFESMLCIYYNKGMFYADEKTIGFVSTMIQSGHTTDIVILDANLIPIDIDDLLVFKELLMDAYFTATNKYSSEMKKLNKARNIKKVLDW